MLGREKDSISACVIKVSWLRMAEAKAEMKASVWVTSW